MVSVNQDMAFWGVSTLSAYPDAGDNCDEAEECHMAFFEKALRESFTIKSHSLSVPVATPHESFTKAATTGDS